MKLNMSPGFDRTVYFSGLEKENPDGIFDDLNLKKIQSQFNLVVLYPGILKLFNTRTFLKNFLAGVNGILEEGGVFIFNSESVPDRNDIRTLVRGRDMIVQESYINPDKRIEFKYVTFKSGAKKTQQLQKLMYHSIDSLKALLKYRKLNIMETIKDRKSTWFIVKK